MLLIINAIDYSDEESIKAEIAKNIIQSLDIFIIYTLDGMHGKNHSKKIKCSSCYFILEFLIIGLIATLQLYELIFRFQDISFSKSQFVLYFFIKVIFFYKISAYNIFYTIINPKEMFNSLK